MKRKGSIYIRNKSYYYEWTIPNGERIRTSLGTADKEEAEAVARERFEHLWHSQETKEIIHSIKKLEKSIED